ncbi:hypothetical protein Tco_0976653 [Tanacetum coccineum]|uniref:Uncharacterized protein n=1 Tax=Tanacetum coccineum TaxID=301880 RepID=A0ABQ5EHW7_9ASTR
MAQQQIILADQLVTTKYQGIGRYVPAVYLQHFWKTVRLVVNANETIRFTMDKEITYTVDIFRSTLKLLVETFENPFITPATLKFIQPFLKIVGYQGNVDKVSSFFSKFLAQPWINILHIFHDVVNRVNVDHVGLLWWDFLHCVQQKKDVIKYPRFTKLIIADLMKKFPSIPWRLEEDYHSIKDDIPLVSVYTTGNVTVKGMLILDEFLTDDIRATPEYKEYEKVFVGVDVPTIQSQPVESTQGMNRTPSAHRTPTPTAIVAIVDDVVQKKKRKQVAGETSSPRKSLKVTIKQKKSSTTSIPPPSDDKERDEITEATLLL